MGIVLNKMLTDLDLQDAITRQVYQFFATRPKQAIGFVAIRDALKINHDKLNAAIKKLKGWKLIVQVGYDAGATYRIATESERVISETLSDLKADVAIERLVAVMEGHETWCRITSTHGARKCTCKTHAEEIKTEEQPELSTEPEPVAELAVQPSNIVRVKMLPTNTTRFITEIDILSVLCDVERATSVEIAALLDAPTHVNRISAVLSSLFTRNMVGRSANRDGGNRAFLYYPLPHQTVEREFTTDVTIRRTVEPKPASITFNDPYKALFMRSIYERIIKGEKLNDSEREALAIALGVTPDGQ